MSEDNTLEKTVVSPIAPYFAISKKKRLNSPFVCLNKHTYLHSKCGREIENERKAKK
jgi:hypothetical protein